MKKEMQKKLKEAEQTEREKERIKNSRYLVTRNEGFLGTIKEEIGMPQKDREWTNSLSTAEKIAKQFLRRGGDVEVFDSKTGTSLFRKKLKSVS